MVWLLSGVPLRLPVATTHWCIPSSIVRNDVNDCYSKLYIVMNSNTHDGDGHRHRHAYLNSLLYPPPPSNEDEILELTCSLLLDT